MASSSSDPIFLDPDHIYDLYLNYRADEVLEYVSSFVGFHSDESCREIKKIAKSLRQDLESGLEIAEDRHKYAAECVRRLTQNSRYACNREPSMVPGLDQMVAHELLQNTVSPQEQEHGNDELSLDEPGLAEMTLDELMQQEELDVGNTVSPQEQEHGYDELSPDKPGLAEPLQEDELLRRTQEGLLYLSEPLSLQAVIEGLMQQDTQVMPTADVQENNETGMISSIYAVMARDGSRGFAGVSLRYNSGQLVYGACFPVGYIELAPVFAHACWVSLAFAHYYLVCNRACHATSLALRSDQFPLLEPLLSEEPRLEHVEEMLHLLTVTAHQICPVLHESNNAVPLALYALEIDPEDTLMYPGSLPDGLIE